MDDTELELARLSGQVRASKMILAAVLGRYAREFNEAEEFIMTITGALSASAGDATDPASAAALRAFGDMADQIEHLALSRLDV